jgi:predicted nucleic acid-binding protein
MSSSSEPASGKEQAVFDASPLVFFDVLGYADLLPELHWVFVPPAVIEELVVLPGEPGSRVSEKGWVERRSPRPETLRQVEKDLTEGRGEKEAIALALDLSALVVLDDKRARNYARRVGLQLTGTLGVLLRLHRLGLAERELEADVALLDEADMRITPELRRMVLDAGTRGQQEGR